MCSKEIGLRVQNMLTILDPVVNIIEKPSKLMLLWLWPNYVVGSKFWFTPIPFARLHLSFDT